MTTSHSRNAWPSSNITCNTSGIMKTRKRDSARVAPPPATHNWMWYGTGLAALAVLFWVYGPAMHTGFLFDDTKQLFALPTASQPLSAWIGGEIREHLAGLFANPATGDAEQIRQ